MQNTCIVNRRTQSPCNLHARLKALKGCAVVNCNDWLTNRWIMFECEVKISEVKTTSSRFAGASWDMKSRCKVGSKVQRRRCEMCSKLLRLPDYDQFFNTCTGGRGQPLVVTGL